MFTLLRLLNTEQQVGTSIRCKDGNLENHTLLSRRYQIRLSAIHYFAHNVFFVLSIQGQGDLANGKAPCLIHPLQVRWCNVNIRNNVCGTFVEYIERTESLWSSGFGNWSQMSYFQKSFTVYTTGRLRSCPSAWAVSKDMQNARWCRYYDKQSYLGFALSLGSYFQLQLVF